jgi:hypothetical protein
MVGIGKMGLSHHAIVNSHPRVKIAAACDTTAYLTDVLGKYTGLKCYSDLDRMLSEEARGPRRITNPARRRRDIDAVETARIDGR